MCLYIRPPEEVMAKGTEIPVHDSYSAALQQLAEGEHLAILARKKDALIAILIKHPRDFYHAHIIGCVSMFIIGDELARRAY